jgi:hypothetical protein
MSIRLMLLVGVLCCVVPAQARAQLLATPSLGGIPVSCSLPSGAPVLTAIRPLGDVGRATVEPGLWGAVPVIVLNPGIVQLPAEVQWFVYGHECMHHRLGHALGNLTLSAETDADCQAIKLLRSQGLLTSHSITAVTSYFQDNPPRPPFYPPGPERAARMLACFGNR